MANDIAGLAGLLPPDQNYGFPAGSMQRLVGTESSGNPNAVNPQSGAQGGFQVMPWISKKLGLNALDPVQGARAATTVLNDAQREYGNNPLAIAAYYNGGHPAANQVVAGQRPFNADYVAKIMGYDPWGEQAAANGALPQQKQPQQPAQNQQYVQMPSGRYYPFDASKMQASEALWHAAVETPDDFQPAAPPPEPTMMSSFMKGAKGLAESTITGVQALWDPEGAARSAIENNKALEKQYGVDSGWHGVVDAYNEGGFGAGLVKFGQNFGTHPLAENAPMLAAAMAGGAAGQAAIPIPGVGAAIGAALALAPSMLSSNIEQQAEQQLKNNPNGGLNIAMGPALAATAGQAVANVGALRFMGAKFIAPFLKAAETDGVTAAEAKLLQLAKSTVAGAAAKGAAVMPADMVMQTVLARWQSGQDLLSPDALDQYGQTAAGAVAVGAVFGGLSHFGTPQAAQARLDQIKAERDQQTAILAQQKKEEEERAQLATASAWSPALANPGGELRPMFEAQQQQNVNDQLEAMAAPPPPPPPAPKFWVNPITGEREKLPRNKPSEQRSYAPAEDWEALMNVPGGDALVPPDVVESVQRMRAQQRAEAAQAEFAPREEPMQAQPLQVTPEPGTAAMLGGHAEMDQIQAGIDAAAAEQAAKVRAARQQQLLPADNVTDFTRRGLINAAREKQEELLEQINNSAQTAQEIQSKGVPPGADAEAIGKAHMDAVVAANELKAEYLQWAEREAAERRAHLGLEPLTPELADEVRARNSALLDELIQRGSIPPDQNGQLAVPNEPRRGSPVQRASAVYLPAKSGNRLSPGAVALGDKMEQPFAAPEAAQQVIEKGLDEVRQFAITPTEEERARWAQKQADEAAAEKAAAYEANAPRRLPVPTTPPGELFPLGAWPTSVKEEHRTAAQHAMEQLLNPVPRPKTGKGLSSLSEMVGTDRTPFHVRGLLNELADFFAHDHGSEELTKIAQELATDVREGRGYSPELVKHLREQFDAEKRAQGGEGHHIPDNAGWESGWYHGSPNDKIHSFKGVTFLTKDKNVASAYAKSSVAGASKTSKGIPRVYDAEVRKGNTLDLRNPEHQTAYEAARQKWNAEHADPDEHLPSINSPGFVQSHTGLPGYGHVHGVLDAMPQFDSMLVDEGSQGTSLAVANNKDVRFKGQKPAGAGMQPELPLPKASTKTHLPWDDIGATDPGNYTRAPATAYQFETAKKFSDWLRSGVAKKLREAFNAAIPLVEKIRREISNPDSALVRETSQAFVQRAEKAREMAAVKKDMTSFELQVAKLNESSRQALNDLDAEFRKAMERNNAKSREDIPPGDAAWVEQKIAEKHALTEEQVERLTGMLTQHHMLLTRLDELSSTLAKLHDTTNAYHPEEVRVANMKRTLLDRMDAIQAERAKVDDLPERIAGRAGRKVENRAPAKAGVDARGRPIKAGEEGSRAADVPVEQRAAELMSRWSTPEKPELESVAPVEGQHELGKALWEPELPEETKVTRPQTPAQKAATARLLVTGDVKRKNPFAKGPAARAAEEREKSLRGRSEALGELQPRGPVQARDYLPTEAPRGEDTTPFRGKGLQSLGNIPKPKPSKGVAVFKDETNAPVVGNPADAKMKKGKRGLTRQGDGPQAAHVDYDEAATRVKAMQAVLGDKVEITHGHDGKEAPTELAAEMAAEGVDPNKEKGWLSADGKRLWINNGAHADMADLEATLAHEIIGHRQAIPIIDKAWEARGGFHGFARALDGSAGGGVDRLLKDLGIDEQYKGADLDTKVKEAIATMEERRPGEGMTETIRRAWKEIVGAVRDWLRQHGLLSFSQANDYDIYNMLRQARNADHLRDANVGEHGLARTAKPFETTGNYDDDLGKRAFGEPKNRVTVFKDKVGDIFGLPNAIKYFDRFAGWTKGVDVLKREGATEAVRDLPTQLQYDLRMFARNGMLAGLAMKTGVMRVVHKVVGDHTERHYEASGPKATEYDDILRAGNRDPEEFNLYMIGKRAERMGWHTLPAGMTDPASIEKLKARIEGGDKDQVFQAARKAYTEYNKALLKFLMDTGYASPEQLGFKEGGKWQLHPEDYVPFYRKDVNGDFTIEYGALQAPIKVGNLNDLPDLKQLIGGKQHLVDMMTGTITNTNMMYRLGLGNQAAITAVHALEAMGIGRELPPGTSGNNVIQYRTWDPETKAQLLKSYRVDNIGGHLPTDSIPGEILVKSLEGLPLSMPPIVRALAQPANWMRHLTLASPFYMMRQMMKEPLAMWLGSGADTSILWRTTSDFARTLSGFAGRGENPQRERALQLGLVSGATLMGDAAVAARELMARSHKPWQVVLASFEKAGIAADSAVRDVYLDQMLQKGMSERDAVLATAVNTVDFFQKGLSPSLGMLRQMVPFFSSQLAALDTFKKALAGQLPFEERLQIQKKFIQRGSLLAAGSIMYAIMSKDQPYYQQADDDAKYGNWMIPFKMNGVDEPAIMRVPIPYEYAYLFKILPEMLVNRLAGDANNAEMFNTVKQTLLDSVPGITPQAIKPFIEAYTNKNFFTGRPILSESQEKLPQNERHTPYTTYWAKQLGFELANVQGTSYGVSPIWIEHFTKSIAGPIGIAAMQVASMPFEDRPARNLSEMPLGGGTFQSPYGERYVNRLEGILSEANSRKAEYDKMISERRFSDAEAFMRDSDNQRQFSTAIAGEAMKEGMGNFDKQRMAIWFNSSLTPEERRQQINQLEAQKQQVARSFGQQAASISGQ